MNQRFPAAGEGLPIPERKTSDGPPTRPIHIATTRPTQVTLARYRLALRQPSPEPVAGIEDKDYPRGAYPADRTLSLRTDGRGTPRMPEIQVQCEVVGFDPRTSPIHWRLTTRQRACRHRNQSGYVYVPTEEVYELDWQGKATASRFTLFEREAEEKGDPDEAELESTDGTVAYLHNRLRSVVGGGQALLEVAASPHPGLVLRDYALLRIAGHGPVSRDHIHTRLAAALGTRPPPFTAMMQAIFSQESDFSQFYPDRQGREHVSFNSLIRGHGPPPNCETWFTHPADPENFPLITFDFGVGLGQFTEAGGYPDLLDAWSWQQNLLSCTRILLSKLPPRPGPLVSWLEWAKKGWTSYNGDAAYATRLAGSEYGRAIAAYGRENPGPGQHSREEIAAWLVPPGRLVLPEAGPLWPVFAAATPPRSTAYV